VNGRCEKAARQGRSNLVVGSIVIPAPHQVRGKLLQESRVSTITLPWRLRSSMQTNLFHCPVIQTVVFDFSTLDPRSGRGWQYCHCEIAAGGSWQSGGGLYCHSCARGNPVGVAEQTETKRRVAPT